MKKDSNDRGCDRQIKSTIDAADFNEAVFLRCSGHNIHSIDRGVKGLAPDIYCFYCRSDTLALLSALSLRSLEVEPIGFMESLADLVLLKMGFRKGCDKEQV